MKLYYIALSFLMISALTSLPSYASSGTVILAKGVVTATGMDRSSRVLAKGGAIEEGDVINTALKSFAVIRMLDNTKLTLKPGTTIAIGKFSVEKGKEEACINLVKGGLRTVTGLIGKRRPDSFQVDTPIASIGIRGTDFTTRICAGDECSVDEQKLNSSESSSSSKKSQSADVAESINEQLPEGLYGSCETGAIVMSKCAGQAEGFELGKCRITQQKDCTSVGLGAGTAGYTGFEPVSNAAPDAGVAVSSDAADGTSSTKSSSTKSSSTKSSSTKSSSKKSSSKKSSSKKSSSKKSSSKKSSSKGSSSKKSSSKGSSSKGSSSKGSSSKGSSSGAAAKSSSKPPVVLSKTPAILDKDPHFALSDKSDAELDKVSAFPESVSTGSGQCSI